MRRDPRHLLSVLLRGLAVLGVVALALAGGAERPVRGAAPAFAAHAEAVLVAPATLVQAKPQQPAAEKVATLSPPLAVGARPSGHVRLAAGAAPEAARGAQRFQRPAARAPPMFL